MAARAEKVAMAAVGKVVEAKKGAVVKVGVGETVVTTVVAVDMGEMAVTVGKLEVQVGAVHSQRSRCPTHICRSGFRGHHRCIYR